MQDKKNNFQIKKSEESEYDNVFYFDDEDELQHQNPVDEIEAQIGVIIFRAIAIALIITIISVLLVWLYHKDDIRTATYVPNRNVIHRIVDITSDPVIQVESSPEGEFMAWAYLALALIAGLVMTNYINANHYDHVEANKDKYYHED